MTEASETTARVLMIDDDERLQNVVKEYLENYGFTVHTLPSGRGLDEALRAISPDILLLDVMLPGDDGFTILRSLRAESKIPVIMLTACGDETDRIIGLEIGADDYLGKPFNPRELLARVKAVLRRAAPQEGVEKKAEDGLLRLDGYVLDERRQSLAREEKSMELSTTEFRILHAFMSRPGEVFSREKLLSLTFGQEHYVCDRNIDVYISRIRAILRRLGETGTRIRTVWGSGYSWVEEG